MYDLTPGAFMTYAMWRSFGLALFVLPLVAAAPVPATRPAEIERELDRVAAALSDLPPGDRVFAWRYELRRGENIARAWRWGDAVVFTTLNGTQVMRVDASTGKQLKPLTDCTWMESRQAWLVPTPPLAPRAAEAADGEKTNAPPAPAAGGAAILFGKRIVLLDGRGGSRQVQREFDVRIGPAPYKGGFVLVEGQRGQTVVRVDADLRDVWRRELPGWVQMQPAVHGSLMVVQTRQSSYGGQATLALDLEKGDVLWKDDTNAYGHGAAFSDDGSIVVESNQWLNPEGTEAWLICREPKTGRKLWEVKRPGGISHRPVVGTLLNRVFAVFDSGRVVCLNGRSGNVTWETPLPLPPSHGGASPVAFEPYRPALHLHENRLMVMDASGTLHWLDMESGRPLAGAALAGYRAPGQTGYAVSNTPLAMPWLHGDSMIVATAHGIDAYPLKHLSAGREPPEVGLRAQRVRLLMRRGDLKEAAAELAMLRAARPASPVTFECAVELAAANKDVESEVSHRLELMRAQGKDADPRLAALTGLVKRVACGPSPTGPLLADGRLYVGAADGMLRAFSAADLSPAGAFDTAAAASGTPALFDGMVVLPLESRRVIGVSADLREKQFDVPQAITHGRYFDVGDRLLCSLTLADYAMAAALDDGRQRFIEATKVANVPFTASPVVHRGRLYYAQPDGASASFDGRVLEVHPPVIQGPPTGRLFLNGHGAKPVAFGLTGVYEVDEHMRPAKRLPGAGPRCRAACRGKGVVVTLSEGARQTDAWLLEAWTDDGQKLPLRYTTRGYSPGVREQPLLLPLPGGDGSFLLVGREVVSFDARREQPLRRFTPAVQLDSSVPTFTAPAFGKDRLFVTHRSGDLYAFDTAQLLRPADGPAPPAAEPKP
jgi:outer membrane protein assembly factor BamB